MFATEFGRFFLSETTFGCVRELKLNVNLAAHKSGVPNICCSLACRAEGSPNVLNITSATLVVFSISPEIPIYVAQCRAVACFVAFLISFT